MEKQVKWLAAVGCLAIGAGTVPLAVAQQDGSDAFSLEEIVVTARKRAETLIEVPVSVSVLTSEDIQQRGVQNLTDVAMFTPGLSYFDAIQNQLGTPVIRGISQTNLGSPDRNVAVFYGGVYLANQNASNLEMLDVERIEVVKGPQSALYGRNAFNGAINYVPASPTDSVPRQGERHGRRQQPLRGARHGLRPDHRHAARSHRGQLQHLRRQLGEPGRAERRHRRLRDQERVGDARLEADRSVQRADCSAIAPRTSATRRRRTSSGVQLRADRPAAVRLLRRHPGAPIRSRPTPTRWRSSATCRSVRWTWATTSALCS